MNTPVSIDVRDLSKRFGEHQAVHPLSFGVHGGELFGIVGPDGAGKTTTLRMLAGILRPTSGDAAVRGASVVEDPEGAKRSVAYMSQRFGLYEDLTVHENLDFYAELYRVPRSARPDRMERLYAFSALGPFRDRLAGNLSGGMKQKLGLSCALIHEPDILLLDEPTFGVDPVSRRDLWLIVHDRVREGVTVVVSTSYLDEAERCDRVTLLHEGRILALDTPESIQRSVSAADSGIARFAVRSGSARSLRDVLRRWERVRSAALFGSSVHVAVDSGVGAEQLDGWIRDRGLDAAAAEPLHPSLEDAFIELVSHAAVGETADGKDPAV